MCPLPKIWVVRSPGRRKGVVILSPGSQRPHRSAFRHTDNQKDVGRLLRFNHLPVKETTAGTSELSRETMGHDLLWRVAPVPPPIEQWHSAARAGCPEGRCGGALGRIPPRQILTHAKWVGRQDLQERHVANNAVSADALKGLSRIV